MIRVKPFLSVALAVAGVAAFSSAAHAQASTASPIAAWEVNIYLQDSERAAAAAALDQASRMPVGSQVGWNDTLTRASGGIVAARPAAPMAPPAAATTSSSTSRGETPWCSATRARVQARTAPSSTTKIPCS